MKPKVRELLWLNTLPRVEWANHRTVTTFGRLVNMPVDLIRLCEITGAKVPPEVRAKLGPNTAVLVHHRLTPFARAGEKSHGIWGMGYSSSVSRRPRPSASSQTTG
jgi:hypothetical protein